MFGGGRVLRASLLTYTRTDALVVLEELEIWKDLELPDLGEAVNDIVLLHVASLPMVE